MIQVIVDKLHLLSQREGLTAILDHNIALMIERTVIATLALLITGDDMDNVVCLQCGMAPKTVLSDGNSKVSYTRSGARVLFQVLERGGGDGPKNFYDLIVFDLKIFLPKIFLLAKFFF